MAGSFGASKKAPTFNEIPENENTIGFGLDNAPNDTKMSDNEAFMAYMNKASHDDDDM
jgi:hypothetical protein